MHLSCCARRHGYEENEVRGWGRGGGRVEGGRQLGDLRMLHAGDGKKRLQDRDYMRGNCRDTR